VAAILPVDRPRDVAAADPAQAKSVRVDSARATPTKNAGKAAEAFRQFESFVLQSFIETMLPKGAESVFGKGTAGTVWKSMLAEKLADQISRSGGIGIAQRIAAGPHAAALPARTEASAPTAVSDTVPPLTVLSSTPERGDEA